MTDLVPVITPTPAPDFGPGPATLVERDARTVRLGDCGIARENLRWGEPPDDDIPGLAAALKAAGQLQPVTVRPGRGKKEEAWMALDGRRRLLALALLLEAGDIDADYPVAVYVETDPARQAAAVLLTNTAVPVHVADVIAAIGRMLKSRLTVTAMARALGYAEIEIRRLAALAALPSAALIAMKAGRLTLKQARLLARLPDKAEQAELAEAVLHGHGFQDWRVLERLDDARVTVRDRRCALVDPAAYAAAGGRTETDLFDEMPAVLLDPDILTDVWLTRVRGIAAVFEAEGIAVHVTAGPEPELPEDLEALGHVFGGDLPAEAMTRYRAQRETYTERLEAVRDGISAGEAADVVDLAIVDMVHARIAADQTGCGERAVTTVVMWPAGGVGVELRCYTPHEPEMEDTPEPDGDEALRQAPAPAYAAPEVEAVEPATDGINHALHAVRTEVATRGLIRALADDPGAALTALIARLFTVLILRTRVARSESALAILATGFAPTGGRRIDGLDGEVWRRLEDRRIALEASGQTVIGWVHALGQDERMSLLAELTAVSLDVREERTSQLRRGARGEATELAALCDAEITRHWTPDPHYLQPHSKGLLEEMLKAMGSEDPRTAVLKKTELVDWVAERAAERRWAPAFLSWRADPRAEPRDSGNDEDDADSDAHSDAPSEAPSDAAEDRAEAEGTGEFEVTPEGQAALARAAA